MEMSQANLLLSTLIDVIIIVNCCKNFGCYLRRGCLLLFVSIMYKCKDVFDIFFCINTEEAVLLLKSSLAMLM